jgi:hypothetical protein
MATNLFFNRDLGRAISIPNLDIRFASLIYCKETGNGIKQLPRGLKKRAYVHSVSHMDVRSCSILARYQISEVAPGSEQFDILTR